MPYWLYCLRLAAWYESIIAPAIAGYLKTKPPQPAKPSAHEKG
ncbi:hypothetical protein EIKCOROL_01594 [Eikenella corrodens ATCC 23834]|uniref:Uncharacterized protein n=1 Tax=Eikenella corrodens ATCC 23834 TaxID=546274 RepID=C0DW44_EIKCO|nr:hypothetical protein EIKCOROL_01594 [Eikenella corrodens ATCC 23834]